jgi:hypothetical protein
MNDWASLFSLLTADNGDNGDNGCSAATTHLPSTMTMVDNGNVSSAIVTIVNGDNGDNGCTQSAIVNHCRCNEDTESARPPSIVTNVTVVTVNGKEKSESTISPLVAALTALERRRPDHIKAADWQHAVEDGRRFVVQWGEQASALGWTATDIFALPPIPENPHPSWQRLSRVDQLGLIWTLHGMPVTALTAEAATIEIPGGNSLRFYRPPPLTADNGDNGDNGTDKGATPLPISLR